MIANGEEISIIKEYVDLINHVHVSEPGLMPLKKRSIHRELASVLKDFKYDRFISIEVGKQEDINKIVEMMEYLHSVFGVE